MNSTSANGFIGNLYTTLSGLDMVWVMAGMALVILILLLILIILVVKTNKLWIRYDLFMRGKDCETLEDNIVGIYHQLQLMQNDDKMNKDLVVTMRRNVTNSIAKSGLVKYNAFPGMGGESSFALTLLNSEDTGYILDAIHSRENCYIYIREVRSGQPVEVISEEEKESLKKALAVDAGRIE